MILGASEAARVAAGEVAGEAATTRDALFGGRVAYHQPARGNGYRVNVDALLLAAFACNGGAHARVAYDLGAGAGAVGLSLLHLGGAARVVFVEIDRDAAALASRNVAANGWSSLSEVVCADAASLRERAGAADLVVCNPPYVAPGRGRAPKGAVRARARMGDVAVFARAARLVAGRRARAAFVYPAERLPTLLDALRAAGLEPKRMRAVQATRDAAARVVLVEARPGKAGGLTIDAPLVEREAGAYTDELRDILGA